MADSLGLFDEVKPPAPAGPGLLHGAGVAATNLLPGLVANVLPSANARPDEPYIPGMVSGAYGSADAISSLVQQHLMGAKPEQVYHLPGGERANELAAGSQELANKYVPHMQPQSETENTIQDYSNLAGSLATPFPAAAAGKLPKLLEGAARFALPGPKVAGVAMAAKAGIDALTGSPAEASQPAQTDQPKSLGLFDGVTPQAPQAPQPITASDAPHVMPLISHYESDDRNIRNIPINGHGSTASGYYQLLNGTWKETASKLGIDTNKYPTAMSAPDDVQLQVATQLYNDKGIAPWSMNPRLMNALGTTQVAGPGAQQSLGLFQPQQPSADGGSSLGLFDPADTKAADDPSKWTYTEAGALVGAGALALAALSRGRITRAGRSISELKFGDLSEKWHAETAANNGIPVSEPPLPGSAGSPITTMRNAVLDRHATMTEFMRSIADTPIVGDQQRAFIGDINGAQPLVQRFQAGYEKGELLGQKIPDLMQNDQAIARLNPKQLDALDLGMHAGDEMDNRYKNWILSGKTSTDAEQRVKFPEKGIDQLRAEFDAAQADPAIKAIMDKYQIQNYAKVDMLVKNGMLTATEGQAFKDAHKTYVPTANLDGIIEDPLLARNITPYSGSSALPHVWDLLSAHDFKLVESTEANRVRSMMVNNIRDWQGKDIDPARPGVKPPTYLKDSKNPVTGQWVGKTDGSSIAFRNNGVLEHVTVHNRQLLDAMKGPAVQVNTAINAINKVRQFQQSWITGAGAIASGHLFPLINAGRSVGEITALRPAGMYGSHFDKWLQQATGGKLALRGDPISSYPGMLYRILSGTTAEASRALSHMLDGNGNSGIGTRLRAVFGNTLMDAMHDRAKAVYDGSTRAAMRDRGLLNSAGFSSSDMASNQQFMAKGGKSFMPQRDMVPELFRMNEMKGMAPTYVKLRNLFDEMRSIIGEAAHANFFELNKDNPNITGHQLNYEVRHITGDPGTRGAGGMARNYGAAVPFGNVSMQEVGRVFRAMHEEPIGTTLGYLTHYGTLAAASAFTAMLAGPQAIQHLFDSTSDPQRSNSSRLYVPGQPENPVELPIQIMMRAPYNLMLQMFHDAFGMNTHADDPDLAMRAQHVLADYFSHHVWQSTIHGMIAGLSSGIPPIMPTGLGPVMTTLTGKTADPNLYEGYMHADKPVTQMFSYDITGANQRLPGQSGKVDPVTGTGDGIILQHILSDVMGAGGVALWNMFREVKNAYAHGEGLGHALDNVFTDYKMRLRDDIPGATLWGGEQKLPRATPLQQRTEQALDAMRPTISWKGDMQYQGLTRKGGQQLIEPIDPNTPTDPTMQKMYALTGQYMSVLDTKPGSPLKEMSDLRKQVDALNRSDLSPETRRSMKNEYERQIQDNYAKTLALVHQLEGKLSDIAGAPVDMRHINWKKGMEQFVQ